MTTQSRKNSCYAAAIAILQRREHSTLELRQKLSSKTFSDNEIEQVIDLLIKENYQSDTRFASEFVRLRVNQGKGNKLIIQQLQQKGIEDFDLSGFDFFALAKAVRVKKYGNQPPKNHQEKAKQQRFLQSRGFDFEQIKQSFVQD